MNHTLKTFTDLTHKMRLAQNRYFELAAKVRKTNHPDDHKARKDALALSKGLENQVDAAIQEINKALATALDYQSTTKTSCDCEGMGDDDDYLDDDDDEPEYYQCLGCQWTGDHDTGHCPRCSGYTIEGVY